MNRRKFVQKSTLTAAGLMAAPALASLAHEKISEFGVQLFTVRDTLQKDFEGTLKSIHKIGYDYCEVFDFAGGKLLGKTIKEAKASFKKNKLPIKSIHVMTGAQAPNMDGTMVNDWQKAVDGAAELGAEYMACAYLLDFERKTIDQYKKLAEMFNKSAEACKKSGIQFLYHNHDFEFQTLEGQVPYDILLNETDADLVKMELDLYWVRYAERDPIKLFRENQGRFPFWHVKDMELAETRVMTEVGAGRIDWKQLFAHSADSGLKGFFVEQDRNWKVDPVSSIETSFKYLRSLRY